MKYRHLTEKPDQSQVAVLNFKNLPHQRTGRILSASELYEIAKQIKYKQLYSMHARSQNSNNQQSPAANFGIDKKSSHNRKVNDTIQESL